MSLPESTVDIAPPPPSYVTRTYGEPRFHSEGDVAALTFAPDQTLWSVDENGVLRHWAEDGGSLKRHFLSDLETLWCFGPDAKLLASANDDLLVWDVADGQLLHRIAQPSWVTAICFSPDGRTIATGHDDGKVRFWDARGQSLVGEINAHPAAVSAVAFSPNGLRIASSGEDRVVRTWDANTHKPIDEFKSHTDRVPSLSWSRDSIELASAGWDTSARVWKSGSPDPQMLLNSHSDQVHVVRFAPNSNLLASADSDYDIYLWSDPAHGKVGHVLRGHSDEIRCLAFNATGTRIASAGMDRVIHIWDVETGSLIAGPNPNGKHFIAVTKAGSEVHLASTAGPKFRVWDVATGKPVNPDGGAPAFSVAASVDGRWLASGGTDCKTRLFVRNAGTIRELEATKPPIGALSFSQDGLLLAHTSPADGLVWIWHTDKEGDAKLILIEAADGCTLETLKFHPSGKFLACGGIDYLSTDKRDGAIVYWNLETGKHEHLFHYGVYHLDIDPSGRYLAGAGVNDSVYLWDLEKGELVFEWDGHQLQIHAVAFDPEGNYVLSAGDDGTLRVWDVLTGRLHVVREFESPIQSLAFGPDGALYAGLVNTTCIRIDFQRLIED
ncbi:MAG: WD40 repeat domain-containing protein [Gemmataceae bacterium]